MKFKVNVLRHMLLITAALLVILVCACQPTPEKAVVVNKNAGVLTSAIKNTLEPTQAEAYEAPERLEYSLDSLPGNYSIVFDAAVDVSDQAAWPVYSVEPVAFTQEQADAVRAALLGDTVLYKPGEFRSREEIQRSIDSYENELKMATEKGFKDIIGPYQQILKDLYEEYERTPEDLVLEQADTDFTFMEDRTQPEMYGGKRVELGEGAFRYEWTDDARQHAIEAGCESIYGICWMDNGRKMEFNAGNNELGKLYCGMSFNIAEGNLVEAPGVTYSLEEAINRADALLKAAGLDFTLVDSVTGTQLNVTEDGEVEETGPMNHMLTYKRRIEGVPQDNIVSCVEQNLGDDYRGAVPPQETIIIDMDDYGIISFGWNTPMEIMATDTPNVTLMPFEDIRSRIEQQLKVQTLWDDNDAEWIDSRRLEIYKLKLSYLQVAKADDMLSFYLMPVWNVCGDMYYHYKDSYPTGESNTYVLDANNERNVWRMRNDNGDYSILTLNAVDGSVMPRRRST